MIDIRKRIDPWFILLIAILAFWWIVSGTDGTPASEIRALEGSDDPALWLDALASGDRSVRNFAMGNALGAVPAERLADSAREAVASPDSGRRLAGLWVLARVGAPGSGEIAAAFLSDENSEVRRTALEVLATDPVPDAHARIVELAKDTDTEVQASAIRALARLRNPEDLSLYVSLLAKSSTLVRNAAGEGILDLAGSTSEVVPSLLAVARGPDLPAARVALELLGRIGGPEALDGLFMFLESGTPALVADAANAIAAIGGVDAEDRALEVYLNSDRSARAQAARVLGALGATEARGYLWSTAQDEGEDFWVRYWSLDALGGCADESLVADIIRFIGEPVHDPRLVRIGIEALGGIDGEEVIELYDRIIAGRVDFGLNSAGGQPALISVIRGFGRMANDTSREHLRSILDNAGPDDFEILIDAIRSLGKVGTLGDIDVLREIHRGRPILQGPIMEAISAIEERYPGGNGRGGWPTE